MATLTSVRNALFNKIWNTGISRDVTVKTLTGSTVDDYGDVYGETYSESTSRAVPYNTFTHQRSFEAWGELQDGESDMVLPYDTTIDEFSLVVDDGKTFEVVDTEIFPFGSGSVATIVRLKEQL